MVPDPVCDLIEKDTTADQDIEGTGEIGDRIALSHFWLSPDLRGKGLGSYLLDSGLHAMSVPNPDFPGLHSNGPRYIELHTHLLQNERAVSLYERRGFQIEVAWVKLVKT